MKIIIYESNDEQERIMNLYVNVLGYNSGIIHRKLMKDVVSLKIDKNRNYQEVILSLKEFKRIMYRFVGHLSQRSEGQLFGIGFLEEKDHLVRISYHS